MPSNGVVRFVLTGDTRAFRQALRGAVDEGTRADAALTRSGRTAGQERARSEREVGAVTQATERARRVSAETADQAILRSARERARAETQLARQREREQRAELSRRRQMLTAGIAGAVGAGSALLGQARGYASTIGIPTRDAMVGSFIDNQQRLIRLAGGQHGATTGAQLQARVSEVSQSTNTAPEQLVRALEVAQNRFSDLGGFAENLEAIARAASVGGGDIADYVGALGEFRRQMGTTSGDTNEALASMIQMMDQGSIEAGDFAANFGTMMGSFHNLRPGSGMGQAREFMAVAEALGSGGVGGDVARTQMGEVMSLMHRRDARRNMERVLGSDVFDAQGRMQISFGELTQRMSQHGDQFTTPEGLSRIFGHGATGRVPEEAVRALTTLVNLDVAANEGREGRAATISELMDSSSSTGQQRIDSTVEEMMNSTSGQALGQSMSAQASFAQHGERVVALMAEWGGSIANLEAEFPLMTEGLQTLRNAAMGAGISLTALSVLNGGGGVLGVARAALGAGGMGAAITGAGGAGGLLAAGATGLVAGVGAAAAITLVAATAGGDDGDQSFAGRTRARAAVSLASALEEGGGRTAYIDAMRGLTSGADRTALSSAVAARQEQGVRLTPETIAALAAAISRGAPADGREPREP